MLGSLFLLGHPTLKYHYVVFVPALRLLSSLPEDTGLSKGLDDSFESSSFPKPCLSSWADLTPSSPKQSDHHFL